MLFDPNCTRCPTDQGLFKPNMHSRATNLRECFSDHENNTFVLEAPGRDAVGKAKQGPSLLHVDELRSRPVCG